MTQHNHSPSHVKVTVIVPVLNARGTILDTIESIRRFKTNQIEVIVLDGGSTDGTQDILSGSMDVIDILRSEPDRGIYDAMNKGVSLAHGIWCIFLGSDDILLDGFTTAVGALSATTSNYYANVQLVSDGTLYNKRYNYFKLLSSNLPHQATFYLVQVLRTTPFDLRYKYLADYAVNLLLYARTSFCYIDCVVALYNDKTGSSSTLRDDAFATDKDVLVSRSGWRFAPLYSVARKVRFFLSGSRA